MYKTICYTSIPIMFVWIFWYLNMNFFETFICSLLIGLVAPFMVWLIKKLKRKKLCAVVLVDEPYVNKSKVSILLWNPMMMTDVYSSDYGDYGFSITADYDTTICYLKTSRLKQSNSIAFNLNYIVDGDMIKIRMGDLFAKSFVKLEFWVYQKDKNLTSSAIIIPAEIRLKNKMLKKPNISLLYDHSLINISIVKYKKLKQFFHWLFSTFIIITAIATVVTTVFTFLNYSYIETMKVSFLGILFTIFSFILFHSIGDVIPQSVIKYMKKQNIIK